MADYVVTLTSFNLGFKSIYGSPAQGPQGFPPSCLPSSEYKRVLFGFHIRFPQDGHPMGLGGAAAVYIGNGIGTFHGHFFKSLAEQKIHIAA
jgi:hypothetical protein